MPSGVTTRVHITVSAHDVLQLLDAAVDFLRVCCKIPLTLMLYVPTMLCSCPINAVQMPQTLQCWKKCEV
jgi:hypothetical protein